MILSAVLVHEYVFCLYLGTSLGRVSALNSSSFLPGESVFQLQVLESAVG